MQETRPQHLLKRQLRRTTTVTDVDFTGRGLSKRGTVLPGAIHTNNLIFRVSEFMATIINNLFFLYLSLTTILLTKALFAALFYLYFDNTLGSLSPIFKALMLMTLTEACLVYPLCQRFKTNSQSERVCYTYDIVTKLTDSIAFLGVLLFLEGDIGPQTLWIFFVPKLLSAIGLQFFFLGPKYPTVLTPTLTLLESVQWLILGLNLAFRLTTDWRLVSSFYFLYAICIFMLALLVIFFTILMVLSLFVKFRANFDFSGGLFLMSFFIYLAWNGLLYHRLYTTFLKMVQSGFLEGKPTPVPDSIYSVLGAIFYLAVASLAILNLSYWLYSHRIRTGQVADQTIIDIAEFCAELNMGAKESDDIMFLSRLKNRRGKALVKSKSFVEEAEPLIKDAQELCLICKGNEADIYIQPCEHSGMCMACIKENLDKEFECPVCRQPIDKLYTLEIDRDTEKYIATPVIMNKDM